ncbi:MAG: hypothetical protein ABIJ09_08850 [Pseudomonadota bacterium]
MSRSARSLFLVLAMTGCVTPDPGHTDATATDATVLDGGRDSAAAEDAAAAQVTGTACTDFHDCGTGYDCYTLTLDGYCMPGAPGGPTACREPDVSCPAGTTCSPLPMHAISGVCLLSCDSNSDCRPGYQCRIVELFPGDPQTPVSPHKVCWTACEFGTDQMCNDDPIISSLHGTCRQDGTCDCGDRYALNPLTGRCL